MSKKAEHKNQIPKRAHGWLSRSALRPYNLMVSKKNGQSVADRGQRAASGVTEFQDGFVRAGLRSPPTKTRGHHSRTNARTKTWNPGQTKTHDEEKSHFKWNWLSACTLKRASGRPGRARCYFRFVLDGHRRGAGRLRMKTPEISQKSKETEWYRVVQTSNRKWR